MEKCFSLYLSISITYLGEIIMKNFIALHVELRTHMCGGQVIDQRYHLHGNYCQHAEVLTSFYWYLSISMIP
jgi:hypothetical protein